MDWGLETIIVGGKKTTEIRIPLHVEKLCMPSYILAGITLTSHNKSLSGTVWEMSKTQWQRLTSFKRIMNLVKFCNDLLKRLLRFAWELENKVVDSRELCFSWYLNRLGSTENFVFDTLRFCLNRTFTLAKMALNACFLHDLTRKKIGTCPERAHLWTFQEWLMYFSFFLPLFACLVCYMHGVSWAPIGKPSRSCLCTQMNKDKRAF